MVHNLTEMSALCVYLEDKDSAGVGTATFQNPV